MIKLLKKVVIVNLLASCAFSSAYAINLKQALESAYNTNEDLKKAQVAFMNSLEQFSQAQAKFLPDITYQYSITNSKNTPNNISGANSVSTLKETDKGIALNQNLFNGGGDMAGLKAAQLTFKSSKFDLYDNEGQSFLKIIGGYLDYLQAKKIYDISDTNVQFNQKQFDATSARLAIGESTQAEVALTKANLYKAISGRAKSQSDLQSAKATFKQLVGIEPDSLDSAELVEIPETLNDFSIKAKRQNFSILHAKNALEAAKAGVVIQAAELLPSLDAKLSVINTSYDRQNVNSSKQSGKNFQTSLVLNIPILSKGGAQYSAVRLARNKSRTAALEFDQDIKKVETQIDSAWANLQACQLSSSAYKMQVEAQASAVESMKKQFDVGSVSIVELLKTQSDLVEAQTYAAQSLTSYVNAVYAVKYIMGELTAKNLKLNVKYFDPEAEFKKIKLKIVGF
jgi:outer membrane protein